MHFTWSVLQFVFPAFSKRMPFSSWLDKEVTATGRPVPLASLPLTLHKGHHFLLVWGRHLLWFSTDGLAPVAPSRSLPTRNETLSPLPPPWPTIHCSHIHISYLHMCGQRILPPWVTLVFPSSLSFPVSPLPPPQPFSQLLWHQQKDVPGDSKKGR